MMRRGVRGRVHGKQIADRINSLTNCVTGKHITDVTIFSSSDKDNPQVEIFKSFRVSVEDPCRVVLPVVSHIIVKRLDLY